MKTTTSSNTAGEKPSRTKTTEPEAYVLDTKAGEHLVHFRDSGLISIKASPVTQCARLTLATQQVMQGAGIPVHRHHNMDELFYVLQGQGEVCLEDIRRPFEGGATIFIPRNSWHSFENPDDELLLLWAVAPAGLEDFFRATCARPGEEPKQLTAEQIRAIALRYGTEFR